MSLLEVPSMTLIRTAALSGLVLCSMACSGSTDDSTVDGGTGAGKGIPGQPHLNLGGSTGSGTGGNGNAVGGDGQCGPNLTGLVRDFRAAEEPGGHPDFETFSGRGASLGIVRDMLGSDKKPVYKPAANAPLIDPQYGRQTTDKTHYDQWYRDTDGVNQSVQFTVPLVGGNDGIATYDNGAFFPVDNQGFGEYEGSGHNFHFTFELHTEFIYKGGEIFTFTGDDDLWVFVNDHLGIDLGGLHPEVSQSIDLDQVAQRFGLEVGKTYPLDLFHAERHTNASHFRVETSIQFTNCDPIIIPR
jgi:fibro-slime domain-containing protein